MTNNDLPKHPTVSMDVGGEQVEVDELIAPLVETINQWPGLETCLSCQGSLTDDPWYQYAKEHQLNTLAYVEFRVLGEDVNPFVVMGDIIDQLDKSRLKHWGLILDTRPCKHEQCDDGVAVSIDLEIDRSSGGDISLVRDAVERARQEYVQESMNDTQ